MSSSFVTIQKLWELGGYQRAQSLNTVDLWGVVLDYRSPFHTRGTHLKCEMDVLDDSIDSLDRKIKLNQFTKRPDSALPMRCVGDIILVTNLEPGMYPGKNSHHKQQLQGHVKNKSAVYLFDGKVGAPLRPLCVLGHLITQRKFGVEDQKRLKQLRNWSAANILRFSEEVVRLRRSMGEMNLRNIHCVVRQLVWLGSRGEDGIVLTAETVNEMVPTGALIEIYGSKSVVPYLRSFQVPPNLPRYALISDVQFLDGGLSGQVKINFVALNSNSKYVTSTVTFLPDRPELNSIPEANLPDHVTAQKSPTEKIVTATKSPRLPEPIVMPTKPRAPSSIFDSPIARVSPHNESMPLYRLHHIIHSDPGHPKRALVSVEGFPYPEDVREFCRPFCRQCIRYSWNQTSEAPEAWVAQESCRDEGHVMSYEYFFRVLLRDRTGDSVVAFVLGEEGIQLLGGIQPQNLYQGPHARNSAMSIQGRCNLLLSPGAEIECVLVASDDGTNDGVPRFFLVDSNLQQKYVE